MGVNCLVNKLIRYFVRSSFLKEKIVLVMFLNQWLTHLEKKSHRHCSTAFQILPAKLRHISHKYANSGYCVCSSSHIRTNKKRDEFVSFFCIFGSPLWVGLVFISDYFLRQWLMRKADFFSLSMTHWLAALWMAFLRVYNWRGLVNELIVLSKMLRKLPKHHDLKTLEGNTQWLKNLSSENIEDWKYSFVARV